MPLHGQRLFFHSSEYQELIMCCELLLSYWIIVVLGFARVSGPHRWKLKTMICLRLCGMPFHLRFIYSGNDPDFSNPRSVLEPLDNSNQNTFPLDFLHCNFTPIFGFPWRFEKSGFPHESTVYLFLVS